MVASIAILGACSSNSASSPTKSTQSPSTSQRASAVSTPAAGSTTGCTSAVAAGNVVLTPKIDGHTRTVRVHVPNSAAAGKRTPLVLNLHGSGSTAKGQEALTGMDAAANKHDFVVAYPQALIPNGKGFDWNVPGVPLIGGEAVPAGSADDITFITSLVRLLEQSYCIDTSRVYSTGFSGGARLTSQLGCDTSDVFAAIAPVSGLRYPSPCSSPAAVPVITFHGSADPVDPFNGNGQAYWAYSVPDAASRWAAHDGCNPASKHQTSTILEYTRCRGGAQVILHIVPGEGHDWPGGPPLPASYTRVAGPQSNAINANNTMWAFFAHYSLPQS